MNKPRVASTIDLSVPVKDQKAVTAIAPMTRPVQFTEQQAEDPKTLARQLTMLHQELVNTTQAVRAHPEQAPITFKNVKCPASGEKVTLTHNFGSFADFIVVKWAGAGTVTCPILVSDESDGDSALTTANQLVLRSYVAGTATIRVFPGT